MISVDAVQALDEVFNWAVGLEHVFSQKLTGYVSYYLDATGLTDQIERAGLSTSPLDINNVTIGTDFMVSSALFTLGIGYGWGSKVDALTVEEGEDFEATFVYRSFRFLFGVEIGVN